jgi:hypothetical protein
MLSNKIITQKKLKFVILCFFIILIVSLNYLLLFKVFENSTPITKTNQRIMLY